ncbi:MAG: hypothetical protein IPO78_17200 [Saprospiraceae bacterium]|nr:hypothetical protein [Saprospiraceae bacterium]
MTDINKTGWLEFIDQSEIEPSCFVEKHEDLFIAASINYKDPVLFISPSMFKYLSENKSKLLQLFNFSKTMNYDLTKYAGKRQKLLLHELESQGIIIFNNGMWERNGMSVSLAKELLLPTDKTLQEQIKSLEPIVFNLEHDAARTGTELTGKARAKLDALKKLYKELY